MVDFACPKCGRQMSRPDSTVEQAGTCPHCGHVEAIGDDTTPQTGVEDLVLEPGGERRVKLRNRFAVLTAVLAAAVVVAFLAWPEKDEAAQANALNERGLGHLARGELDEAERMFRKALAIFERVAHQEGIAVACSNLGLIYQTRGKLDEAERMHRKALAIEERLGLQEGMAESYNNLGTIYQTRGKLDEADQMYRKSLDISERLGLQVLTANQYGNLGIIYEMRGKLDEAREFWMKARDLYARIGMPHEVKEVQGWLDELDAEHPTSGPATPSRE